MLAVMLEFAYRVADRSPPVKSTSMASAFAMSITLSVMAFTSSREYIGGREYHVSRQSLVGSRQSQSPVAVDSRQSQSTVTVIRRQFCCDRRLPTVTVDCDC